MKRSATIFYLLLATLAATAQTEDAGVRQAINNLFDGMRKSDTALLRSAFAEGAILQSVSVNKDKKVAVETETIDSFIVSIARPHKEVYDEQITFDLIRIDDNLAIAWTPYRFYIGSRFSHCGVDSYQLVKLDGQWKIQYLIDTRRREGCQ